MKLLKSELQYSAPFRNAKATNEGESDDFAHLNTKTGYHGNVPCRAVASAVLGWAAGSASVLKMARSIPN